MKDFKESAWVFYSKWRLKGSYSPALKKEVTISRLGWNHITGKYKNKRTDSDVSRRLKLLKKAQDIIEVSTTIQNISIRKGSRFIVFEAVVDVKNLDRRKGLVRVILLENKEGKSIFLSVMNRRMRD